MKKITFPRVKDSLKSLYGKWPQGNAMRRLNTLCGLVTGMLNRKSSHLADLGSGLEQDINAASREISTKRFLENK